jgi:hypothetical protein
MNKKGTKLFLGMLVTSILVYLMFVWFGGNTDFVFTATYVIAWAESFLLLFYDYTLKRKYTATNDNDSKITES